MLMYYGSNGVDERNANIVKADDFKCSDDDRGENCYSDIYLYIYNNLG